MSRPLFLLIALLGAAACGPPSAGKPLGAVDAYVAALRSKDFGRAYDLMSERYRRTHGKDEFVRQMKESPREVEHTISRLSSSGRRVDVEARFLYDDLQDELRLVQEGGSWKIANDPLDFYPQDTPGHTLRSFVRAVELKRYDIVLRFVPDEWRKQMTEAKVRDQFEGPKKDEVQEMLRRLVAHIDNPIQQDGDEARMPYGERSEVKFVRENGLWKIADPD